MNVCLGLLVLILMKESFSAETTPYTSLTSEPGKETNGAAVATQSAITTVDQSLVATTVQISEFDSTSASFLDRESSEKCKLTMEVPISTVRSTCQNMTTSQDLKKLKQHFQDVKINLEKRMDSLSECICSLGDTAKDDRYSSLEGKFSSMQHEMEKMLKLLQNKAGALVNAGKAVLLLKKEKEARMKLEKRVLALEKSDRDIDCRLMKRPGVYSVWPVHAAVPFQAYCDNRWTILQRRNNGSVNFYRNWLEYKTGFGNLDDEFWIGNDIIHQITTQAQYKLRIEMVDWYDRIFHAEYSRFWIDDEHSSFRLHVSGFTGNVANALQRRASSPFAHNLMAFTTYDRNNGPKQDVNCAVKYQGAWWYNNCYAANLNGHYCQLRELTDSCIVWYSFGEKLYMKQVVMKIKEQGK